MTDQPRTPTSDPVEEPGRLAPVGVVAPATEAGAAAADLDEPVRPGEAVRVFTGSELPEPGSAEAISSIEDPTPASEDPVAAVDAADPVVAPSPPPRSRTGALLGSGLVGGLVGAGLTFGAQALWMRPLDRLKDRVAQVEERSLAAASQNDARAAAGRLAAIEAETQALGQRVDATRQLADSAASRAEEAARRPTSDPTQAAAIAQLDTRLTAVERGLAERGDAIGKAQTATEQRLASQESRIADLARQAAQNDPQRLDAALRVIASDRAAAALRQGQPLGPYLPALQKMKADAAAVSELQSYASAPPPSAADLARDFKPIAERLRAESQPAAAGDTWSDRLIGIAGQVVSVRPTAPVAGGSDPSDALGRIERALATGALPEAAAAWDSLPEAARAASQPWGDSLKRRVAADAAARQMTAQAAAALDAAMR